MDAVGFLILWGFSMNILRGSSLVALFIFDVNAVFGGVTYSISRKAYFSEKLVLILLFFTNLFLITLFLINICE